MTSFERAMAFVERERAFPADPSRVHGRRFAALLDRVGIAPRLSELPSVVVAGSAGKGSTARMIAALVRGTLDELGDDRAVVLGTKPPLRETDDGHRERYQTLPPGGDARWLARGRFVEHVEALAEAAARVEDEHGPLAPYDLRYAVLAREAAESGAFAVVEANIGLRNDVARHWPGARGVVLTRMGSEHARLLDAPEPRPAELVGLGALAGPLWHKAGGVLPGRPVVSGAQVEPRVADAIDALVRRAGASAHWIAGRDFDASLAGRGADGVSGVATVDGESVAFRLGLLGGFQIENAATAIAAVRMLQREGVVPGDLTTLRAAASRLSQVVVPGRLELVSHRPTVVRNVTEAPTKAESMIASLRGTFPGRRWVVALSVLSRVEGAAEIVERIASAPEVRLLLPLAWHLGPEQRDLHAQTIGELAAAARGELEIVQTSGPTEALAALERVLGPDEIGVVVGDGAANAWEVRLEERRATSRSRP